jgi:hypothetical protein
MWLKYFVRSEPEPFANCAYSDHLDSQGYPEPCGKDARHSYLDQFDKTVFICDKHKEYADFEVESGL